MTTAVKPGLQYPPNLEESEPTDVALRMIVDNLFYLHRVVLDQSSSIQSAAGQVQRITNLTLNTGPSSPAAVGASVTVGTHAIRLSNSIPTLGTMFYETDRAVLYVVSNSTGVLRWQYVDGAYYAVFASRPRDLGTDDIGFLYIPTEHLHWCRWAGGAWVIVDDDGGTFKESVRVLGVGYQLCDGTATSYLTIAGVDLAQTTFTTPDEITVPGVYHKSIAAYVGTINAASSTLVFAGTPAVLTGTISSPAFTGTPAVLTGNVAAPTFTGTPNTTGSDSGAGTIITVAGVGATVSTHVHSHTYTPVGTNSAPALAMDSYTPTGSNSVPTLTMNSYTPAGTITGTAEPRNLGVLRYFRR